MTICENCLLATECLLCDRYLTECERFLPYVEAAGKATPDEIREALETVRRLNAMPKGSGLYAPDDRGGDALLLRQWDYFTGQANYWGDTPLAALKAAQGEKI